MASQVDGPSVLLSGEEAAMLAAPLVKMIERLRRDGVEPNPKLAHAVLALEVAGRSWRDRGQSFVCESAKPIGVADLASSRLMTASEVAQLLGTSATNVRQRSRRGSLPGVRMGDRWLFDLDAVADELRRREGVTEDA